MYRTAKWTIILVMLLLFARDLCLGVQFRRIGEKTGVPLCFSLANGADAMAEWVETFLASIEENALFRVEAWKEVARHMAGSKS